MKNIALILLSLALFGTSGCATTGSYATGGSGVDYEKFHDSHGEYRIVSRNNDLYIEKVDGSEKKRLTYTPEIEEYGADFSDGMKYIVYGTINKKGREGCYLLKREDGEYQAPIPITFKELWDRASK